MPLEFKTFGGGAANEAGNAGKAGDNPPATAGGITLKEAWHRYRDAHLVRKGRSKRTIESYRDHVERIFVQWLETPLQELAQERPAGPGRRVFRPALDGACFVRPSCGHGLCEGAQSAHRT